MIPESRHYDPRASEHDWGAILKAILDGYALDERGCHGVLHWARVFENGQRIASRNGSDAEVVALFSLFHDSRRINERRDSGHGQRGGDFARSLRGELVHLSDERFELLFEACSIHTGGFSDDPTIGACLDSDRLDLGRVGTMPRAKYLNTEPACELIDWAYDRSIVGVIPDDVLVLWRMPNWGPPNWFD